MRDRLLVYAELKVLSVKLLDKTIQGEVHASHEDAAVTVLIYHEDETSIEAAQEPGGYIDAAEVVAMIAFESEGYDEALMEQAWVDDEGNTGGAQATENMASSRFGCRCLLAEACCDSPMQSHRACDTLHREVRVEIRVDTRRYDHDFGAE
ncbi:hypothetical protein LTR17_023621 [Elasticomyces elasticus]|nr:hypothetical protein LTR17_023621 [Elasticomyces elasticus]